MGRFTRILALTTAMTALVSTAALADVVKIGVLAPLTGPTASDGEEFVRGVELAVEEANAKGGVAGYTFEVVTADVVDHSAANVTSAVERLLATDGVEVILTGYASLSLFEVELMAEANMPYMPAGPSPQFAAIVSQDPDEYNCCWSFTADFKGYETEVTPTIDGLSAQGYFPLKDKTVAIISSDNPYSKTISEGMKKVFAEDGWTITLDELVPFGPVSDWRPILAKIRENPPEVIINTDYIPGNAALFTNQFRENPTNSLVFLQYAPLVPEFVKLTGDKSNGILYNAIGATLNVDSHPRGKEVFQKYKDKYDIESGAYGTGLYEMTTIYFDALEKVGDPKDHDAIGKAIGETKRPITAGFLEFDPATHVAKYGLDYVPVTFFQLQDGKGVMISPDKYKSGDFKTPDWMSK